MTEPGKNLPTSKDWKDYVGENEPHVLKVGNRVRCCWQSMHRRWSYCRLHKSGKRYARPVTSTVINDEPKGYVSLLRSAFIGSIFVLRGFEVKIFAYISGLPERPPFLLAVGRLRASQAKGVDKRCVYTRTCASAVANRGIVRSMAIQGWGGKRIRKR